MKKIFSFALVALALASCKNAEEVEQPVVKGTPELNFAITAKGFAPTRASETSVDKIYLYVFKDDANKTCEKVVSFANGWNDSGLATNGSAKEYKMEITSGGKYILVSGNVELKAGASAITAGTTKLADVLATELAVTGTAPNAATLSGSFPMVAYKYYYVKDLSANTDGNNGKNEQNSELVEMALERLWAKVETVYTASFLSTFKTNANLTADPSITLTMRNIAKGYKYTNTNIGAPVAASNGTQKATHTPIYPTLTATYLNQYWTGTADSYKNAANTTFTGTNASNVFYIPENQVKLSSVANTPTMNSVTYAQICVKVKPEQVHNGTGMVAYTTDADVVLAYKDGAVYKESGKVIWFKDAASARTKVPGCTPYVYTQGKMYYRVDLIDSGRTTITNTAYEPITASSSLLQKYNVIRNTYYKITLSGVKSFDQTLPATRPDDLDGVGDQALGTPTLWTDITVAPWTEININSNL